MIVCVCHRVSDRQITQHALAGDSFDEIQLALGVATQCGQCEGCARDVVARCAVEGKPAACAAQHVQFVPPLQVASAWNFSALPLAA